MNYPEDADDLNEGKFTDGDPIAGIAASVASADYFNAVYDEMITVIKDAGIAATPLDRDGVTADELSRAIQILIQKPRTFSVTGDANDIVLTTENRTAITALQDQERITFNVALTNTNTMTVTIDDLAPLAISNIVDANQAYAGALVTLMYQDGALYLIDQINPKTGHTVEDIGKLLIDTTDVLNRGEVALDGAELSRVTHSIAWEKIRATSNLIDQTSKDADPITYGGYYGEGDGENTFTLPIVGGEFIRLFDNGRGVDAGRGFGSWQESDNKSHGHYLGYVTSLAGIVQAKQAVNAAGDNGVYSSFRYGTDNTHSNYTDDDTVRAIDAGGDESRPRSIAYYAKTRL